MPATVAGTAIVALCVAVAMASYDYLEKPLLAFARTGFLPYQAKT